MLVALEKAILNSPILCLQVCVPFSSLVPGLVPDSPPHELTESLGSCFCCWFGELIQLSKQTDSSASKQKLVAWGEGRKHGHHWRDLRPYLVTLTLCTGTLYLTVGECLITDTCQHGDVQKLDVHAFNESILGKIAAE